MKIINLQLIDTFTLSQEDVADRPLRERKDYAFQQCVSQVMEEGYATYSQAFKIVEDSLTYLQVNYS